MGIVEENWIITHDRLQARVQPNSAENPTHLSFPLLTVSAAGMPGPRAGRDATLHQLRKL